MFLNVKNIIRVCRSVEFKIICGQGINRLDKLLELGVKHGTVEKVGTWYS